MSVELFETLSLAARYLFALLGVLIVLRAFLWLLSERGERHHRVRRLPWSGMIGEFIVVSGDTTLPEGMAISIPWEGTIGSVRSCDVYLPCAHVKRKHLSFFFEPGQGLRILPFSGCEAMVNGNMIHCKSGPEESTMTHGSFLQAGNAVLRLRVLAGLDPRAGFQELPSAMPAQAAQPMVMTQQPEYIAEPESNWNKPTQVLSYIPESVFSQTSDSGYFSAMFSPQETSGQAEGIHTPAALVDQHGMRSTPAFVHSTESSEALPNDNLQDARSPAPRRRRSERWEVDWSE